MDIYVSPEEAAKYFSISLSTLRRWANKQKIDYKRTEGGHRRYRISQPKNILKTYIKRSIYPKTLQKIDSASKAVAWRKRGADVQAGGGVCDR